MLKFDNEDVEFITHPNRKGVSAPFLMDDVTDHEAQILENKASKKLKKTKILRALGNLMKITIPPLIMLYTFTGIGFINYIQNSISSKFHVFCAIFLGGVTLASYNRARKTKAGPIPNDWKDWNGLSGFREKPTTPSYCETSRKIQQTFDMRFCRHCQVFQPPRCYHCSKCDACVCRMDHHCVFINNCVGIGNHRFFLQFLVWLMASLVHWGYLWTHGHYYLTENTPGVRYLIVSICLPILGFLSFLFVGAIFLQQLMYLHRGATNVEKKYFASTVGLYNLGFWKNLQLVMNAPKTYQWILPVVVKDR